MEEYHTRIFGSRIPSHIVSGDLHTNDGEIPLSSTQEEEDDYLGYYPDGNKRTLTDDQIAMFRHSEIYSILRERQLRKENQEAELDDDSEIVQPSAEVAPECPAALGIEKQAEQTPEAAPEEPEIISKDSRQDDARPGLMKSKRKRDPAKPDYGRDNPYTARRTARELDSSMSQDCVLDYGDEPSAAEPSIQAHLKDVKEKDNEEHSTPTKGQKIWWPVIQGT